MSFTHCRILCLIPMFGMKITSNIMSLGGIAITIGVMIDAAIVMVENAHKHIETEKGVKREDAIINAAGSKIRIFSDHIRQNVGKPENSSYFCKNS